MSNNPHGHIGQSTPQNPSWNPLQIPSYIPRQPQLAHMSNERPMVRSPLTWHAPAPPPDSIYNFMSANHKNLEHQMNPLLSPYMRGPPPFDSMDLSLQSNRSANSPLAKGGVHQSLVHQEYGGHKQSQQHAQQQHQQHTHQQQQQSQMLNPSNYPIHNLSTSSPASPMMHAQQQQATSMSSAGSQQHTHGGMQNVVSAQQPPVSSAAAVPPNSSSAKYLNANGGDCEAMRPPASSAAGPAAGAVGGPTPTAGNNNNNASNTGTGSNAVHYMQDAEARLNESYGKMSQINRNYESELQQKSMQKPVELVNKDCGYAPLLPNKLSSPQQVGTKKQSPLRNYHTHQQQQQQQQQQHQQQQPPYNNPPAPPKHNGPHTPPTPQSPGMHPAQAAAANVQQQMQQHGAMHNNNTLMDYNQLHLQQQSSYNPSPQQQQHLPPHLQQQNMQHYSHHQQQQHQLQQPHTHQQQQHVQHSHMPQHHAQQQQQQHMHQPANQQQQHHSPMHHQHHGSVSNLDNYIRAAKESPSVTGLSPLSTPAAYKMPPAASSLLPDSAESPDEVSQFNDEESHDSNSNSNSSGSRQRNKRKSNKVTRIHSTESESEVKPLKGPRTPPEQPRKSPRKLETVSPKHSPLTSGTANAPIPPPPALINNFSNSENMRSDIAENGSLARTTAEAPSVDDVETIDKIAAMIAKTTSQVRDAEHKNESLKGDADLSSSPKTKKQRQALKLRNAEHNFNASSPALSANDNAVGVEELDKESNTAVVAPPSSARAAVNELLSPLSPQSPSQSSSSSSSSSSCSNSSRSVKCHSKASPKKALNGAADQVEKENMGECNTQSPIPAKELAEGKESATQPPKVPTSLPLNLNSNNSSKAETSPLKSFEEVEKGLKEMFAGIEEDEPLPPADAIDMKTSTSETDLPDLNLALQLSDNTHTNSTGAKVEANDIKTEDPVKKDVEPVATPVPTVMASVPTKAAKKSNPLDDMPPAASPSPLPPTAQQQPPEAPPRRMFPPRRLSVALDPANLRISIDSAMKETKLSKSEKKSNKDKEFLICLDDEKPSTSAAAKAALEAKIAADSKPKSHKKKVNSAKKYKGANAKSSATGVNTPTRGRPRKNFSSTVKHVAKQSKEQQKQQRRQNSSDDEAPPNREAANATEQKYKSPYILVKGDGSISVINTPTAAEDVDEKQIKVRKLKKPVPMAHNRKHMRGLHMSTLSNKYDAHTTDSTWICVFCKLGPHKFKLGDLFGPYFIPTECEEYKAAMATTDAPFESKRRRSDMVQNHPRNLPAVQATLHEPATVTPSTSKAVTHKKKKKFLEMLDESPAITVSPLEVEPQQDNLLGLCKVSEVSYEAWMHEDCIVWAPGVFLIGDRITGIEAAVWNSTRYLCALCDQMGAVICCQQRDCKSTAHVPCARQSNWSLDLDTFKVHCNKHPPQQASNLYFHAGADS